ncbi:transglutaminase-like domain-containing protein [Gimesia aquarii]|uniref:Transglutaminase-like superfamily protein n=1 Tax=Gimesia aquarii TaxID=2527964 RepID=A0A517WP87_9PLAN|nr:transglutaminase-like domain-containing protein [Gimesia aquarii]QDU07074.1 Transglutaminase-like superfamily protein [Gimesia aquarii]
MQTYLLEKKQNQTLTVLTWISIFLFLLSICACSQNPASETGSTATSKTAIQDEDVWQVIYVNSQRIGYAYSQTRIEDQAGVKVIRSQSDSFLKIKRFGQVINMGTHLKTTENTKGELLSYTFEMKNPPADSTVSKGVVEDGKLKINTQVANKVKQSELKWNPAFHAPSYLERIFKMSQMKPGEEKSFSMLLPEYNKVTEVKLLALDYETTELYGDRDEKCLHVKMTQSALPGMIVDLYVTEDGEIPKTAMDFLGSSMLTYTVSKETALEEISGEELDLAVQTLIKVKSLPRAHDTTKVVYKVTLPGEDPAKLLATGETQQIKSLDKNSIELTVSKAPVPTQFPKSKVGSEFVTPTQFVQSDDPRIIKYAKEAVKSETNPWKQALLMERYVYKNLRKKNFSTALASAAEVAKNMEGDCTEHAVLLAAMLRAQNLPSRVAVGMVYIPSRSSFGGHMWTEVFLDNRWIPLDATLGKGGIGAGHIKLTDSSLADNAPAPLTIFLPLLQTVGKLSIEIIDSTSKSK